MKLLAVLSLLFCAVPLGAQVTVSEAELSPEAAAPIVALYNDPGTSRLTGDLRIAEGSELGGDVAVLEGTVTIAGHVRGKLIVINGNLIVEQGARVDGTVTVIGGSIQNIEQLSAAGVVLYRERLKYELRDGTLVLMREVRPDEIAAGRAFQFGRTDLLVAARGSYNRSEGLPIHLGPRITLGRSNPTRLEALFILRTAAALEFGDGDYGYAFTAEQYVGGRRAARVGVRFANEVLPVETWGLSDHEASITAFVLHSDHRDHYMREGWSAYLAAGRRGLPFDWRIEYSSQRFGSTALRDPVTVWDNDERWRPELLVPEVRLHTLRASGTWDTRNDERDPSTGWLVRSEVESATYHYGLLDIRRFARLTPNTRVALRAIAAGSLDGDALPAFRQQSLGGAGVLPAYELYEFDCGAHDATTDRVPYFGCDNLLFFQFEYQTKFAWLSQFGRSIGRDFGLLEHIKGVLFFDTGRAWNEPEARGIRGSGTDDFVADAGFGLRFGPLGVYWGIPLSARAAGMNFFVRLRPRI